MNDKLKAYQKEYSQKSQELEKIKTEVFEAVALLHSKTVTFNKDNYHCIDYLPCQWEEGEEHGSGVVLGGALGGPDDPETNGRFYINVEVVQEDGIADGYVFIEDILKGE